MPPISDVFAVGPEPLRDGEGWAVETFTRLGSHNSTHVDAPYHYNSTIQGEPSPNFDREEVTRHMRRKRGPHG